MEEGILKISKTKKGRFHATIEYEKKSGKKGLFIVTANIFDNDALNGKKCTFKREKGALAELHVEGKQIYPDPKQKVHKKVVSKQDSDTSYSELFDAEKICVPNDTKDLLSGFSPENYSLKLNKTAFFNEKARPKPKFEFFKAARRRNEPIKFVIPDFIGINFDKLAKKYDNLPFDNKQISLKQTWRMALGLGHENVYETGITLHHIYGIPYIPASSVKGVVRSYIMNEYFGNPENGNVPSDELENPLKKAEERALKNESFVKIFGDQENAGKIIFFDAFPTEAPKVEPDIMNPHYPKYYGNENEPPTDYQNPIPIPFLTVKDTKFQFIIGSKKEPLSNFEISEKNIDDWLKEALENHGIGAKTAVGYGRMKTDKSKND
jgi:CRISPR-associated protein Cmr6